MFENGKVFRLKARKREGKGREKETKLEVLHGNMFLQPRLIAASAGTVDPTRHVTCRDRIGSKAHHYCREYLPKHKI